MSEKGLTSYQVWDPPTRWFHWINFISVVALLLSGFLFTYRADLRIEGQEAKMAITVLHTWIGYVFALNLLGRVVWGFLGNRYARWRAVLPDRRTLGAAAAELRSVIERRPYEYLGRGPLSRLAVSIMFALLIVQAGTGLTRAGTDLYYPPFGPLISAFVVKPGVDRAELDWTNAQDLIDPGRYRYVRPIKFLAGDVHRYAAYGLIAMIVLHIGGVALTEVRQGSGVVSAMFSGRKTLRGTPADKSDFETDRHA